MKQSTHRIIKRGRIKWHKNAFFIKIVPTKREYDILKCYEEKNIYVDLSVLEQTTGKAFYNGYEKQKLLFGATRFLFLNSLESDETTEDTYTRQFEQFRLKISIKANLFTEKNGKKRRESWSYFEQKSFKDYNERVYRPIMSVLATEMFPNSITAKQDFMRAYLKHMEEKNE